MADSRPRADCTNTKEEELFSAYSSGDIDGVISLIDAGASPFTTDDKGNTLFHLCCTNNTHSNTHGPRILQSLITTTATPFLSVISSVNNDGNTPLHLACSNGLTECVQLLLSCSPVIFNVVTDNMIQCITDAASWEIIQLLLMKITLRGLMDMCNKCERTRHFLRLFPKNEHFQLSNGMTTLLHLVATSGDLEYFTATVSIGLDINCFDNEGYTPLHRAIEYGCVSIAKYLINQPNCLCETLTCKYTAPLHDAAGEYGDVSIVQCLVERGVDINVSSSTSAVTPLHYSCRWGHLSIVEYLTSLPQFNYTRDNWGRTGIHYAAEFGQAHVVKYLTEVRGYDINVEDKYDNTPLYMACYYDHLPVVEYFSTQPNCDINSNNNGSHPLIVATDKERLNIVKYLIDSKGCDINVREKTTESTSLHKACYNGSLSIVEYLISKPQCNIEAIDSKGKQPLYYATCQGHKEIILLLGEKISMDGLSECIRLTEKQAQHKIIEILKSTYRLLQDNSNLLLEACASGHIDIVHHLVISKHCDINAKGSRGYAPLHYACENGKYEIVKFLTDHPKCDIESKTYYGQDRPLHKACESGHVDIVRHLVISKHCDINTKGSEDYTPLHYACKNGHFEIIKILTDHPKCDIESKAYGQARPLHKACESGHVDIVRHLVIDKHCDINAKGPRGYTPLHYACEKGKYEIVKFLTDCPECNIKAEDNSSNRALHVACWHDSTDIVRHLVINKHCDINAKGSRGYTPLHYACESGRYEIVKFLTDCPECNIKAEDNSSNRALHVACWHDSTDIVRHLVINKHCDINAKGSRGYTPLHYACESGRYEIVKFLTDCPECNIKAEDNSSKRALHVACWHDSTDIVRHLVINKHCDINAKGSRGYTPLHYACKNGKYEIVKFLTDHPKCDMEAEDHSHRKPLQVALDYWRSDRQMRTNAIKIMKYLVGIKGCSTHRIISDDPMIQDYLCRAQQFSGIALLCVVKCILTGPPGAGKSTLKKRLLNQFLDTEPSLSTGVVDAAVQVNSFRKILQYNAVVTTEWKEQELDEEAVLITKKLLPSQSTLLSVENDISSSVPPEETDLPLATVEHNTSANSSPIEARKITTGETSSMEHENENDNIADIVNDDEEEGVTDIQVQDSSSTGVGGLSNYVMSIPTRKRQEYERKFEDLKDDDHTMLHIIDTGGQPEFHEILPALITGPAINLLVFKLTEDLRSRYKIIYRSPTGESNPYETSLTHEEVIFRSLASIACLRQNTTGWSFDEVPIEDKSEPAAFLIATHRDQVEEDKVDEVNQQLRTKIENSSHLFDSNLVQFSQSDQVIFPLDTTKDEEEIKHLRSILHRVISERFHELQIPASWCTLSLKLRKSKRKLFKYDTCFQLAQECGIKNKEEFHNALWYLHHRVGIIMYYPNVKGLEDIIITDLQLVFDRITNLITTCFTFEQSGSAAVEKEFRKNGRFSESQVDEISLREKGDPLNSKRLVALLKHLYIVAGPMKTKVGRKNVNYYFMPCALKPADVEREERDKSLSPSPLLICFECGYTPVGVFCCLVVYLLDQKTDQVLQWKLTGNDQYRNRISFEVGQYYDTVILISRATYLEVWVQQAKGSKLSTSDLCDKILSSLHKGLETVTKSLHYTYKSRHMFGVPCTACPAVSISHPAVIEFNEEAAKCINGNIRMNLNEEQLHWSKKVC